MVDRWMIHWVNLHHYRMRVTHMITLLHRHLGSTHTHLRRHLIIHVILHLMTHGHHLLTGLHRNSWHHVHSHLLGGHSLLLLIHGLIFHVWGGDFNHFSSENLTIHFSNRSVGFFGISEFYKAITFVKVSVGVGNHFNITYRWISLLEKIKDFLFSCHYV